MNTMTMLIPILTFVTTLLVVMALFPSRQRIRFKESSIDFLRLRG